MTFFVVLLIITLSVFVLGYYLGHQYGSTAKIREDLREARENQVTARIDNR